MSARIYRPFIDVSVLPTPRIEVCVARKANEVDVVQCEQNLVMGLVEGDSRREQYVEGRRENKSSLTLYMGGCNRDIGEGISLVNDGGDNKGWIFCDDALIAHAIWDGRELGLPVFLVAEDRCQRMDRMGELDQSDQEVFLLMSDTDSGTRCSLHASRALAEVELRYALGEYTTNRGHCSKPRFSDDRVDELIEESRNGSIVPKEHDWFKIEQQKVRGLSPRIKGKHERAPMVMAFQVYGLSTVEDDDSIRMARPLSELRVAADDRRWISVWEKLIRLASTEVQTTAIEAGSVVVRTEDGLSCRDLGIGICDAAKKASAAGAGVMLIRLVAVIDPAISQCERVRTVMAQDYLGDYERPEDVPEWKWIEAQASFTSKSNGTSGVWEFMLNMSFDFEDVPEKLERLIQETKADGVSWLMFHQGT